MLFHFDLSDPELAAYNREVLELAVSELCRAYRRGYHIVSMSRSSAAWIYDNCELMQNDRAIIRHLGQEFSQTGRLRNRASIYIQVVGTNSPVQRQGTALQLDCTFILQNEVLSPARLIVENMDNDGWVMSFIIDQIKRYLGIPQTKSIILHGGGGDVLRVLPQSIKDRNIACLIMDTDKDSPSDRGSGKVDQAVGICRDTSWPFCFVYPLPCREAENLVPLEILLHLNNGRSVPSCDILLEIEEVEVFEQTTAEEMYRRFIDLKFGVNDKTLQDMKPEAREWHEAKHRLSKKLANKRVISGFGERIFEQIMGSNELISYLRDSIHKPHWRNHYFDFFADICWIYAATRRSSV